jgi:hypothetical protein
MRITPSDELPTALLGDGHKLHRPWITFGAVIALWGYGLGLVFQSSRWYRTPAYANLLHITSADVWGYVYLGVGGLMALGLVLWGNRALNVAAHTLAFVLLAMWEVAFIVRYLTDSSTTVSNTISWAAYMFLLFSSALTIDRKPHA